MSDNLPINQDTPVTPEPNPVPYWTGSLYGNDYRYPPPKIHEAPRDVLGLPTQADLDAIPRMFTWGDLKGYVQSGNLDQLIRNRAMQVRYDKWIGEQKEKWGSTERYLTQCRLPWKDASRSRTPDPKVQPVPALAQTAPTPTHASGQSSISPQPSPNTSGSSQTLKTPPQPATNFLDSRRSSSLSTPGSGTSTPSSAGYVSLESLLPKMNKLLRRQSKTAHTENGRSRRGTEESENSDVGQFRLDGNLEGGDAGDMEEDSDDDDLDDLDHPVFLKFDPEKGLDEENFAVLPNDWPYCIPYGVKHYCVWSRIPIAHPITVNYDPVIWANIEAQGLGGFTGVTPYNPGLPTPKAPSSSSSPFIPNSSSQSFQIPSSPPYPSNLNPEYSQTPVSSTSLNQYLPPRSAPQSPTNVRPPTPVPTLSNGNVPNPKPATPVGRGGELKITTDKTDYYALDIMNSGGELKAWAGVEYESLGGKEVGNMVRGLWDERGWECLWFVNPPRLQSIPGFSHFHVFARRKTPVEIDASEVLMAKR